GLELRRRRLSGMDDRGCEQRRSGCSRHPASFVAKGGSEGERCCVPRCGLSAAWKGSAREVRTAKGNEVERTSIAGGNRGQGKTLSGELGLPAETERRRKFDVTNNKRCGQCLASA